MSQKEIETRGQAGDSEALPATRGELREMLGRMMTDMISNSQNARTFASVIMAEAMEALKESMERNARRRDKILLSRTYYAGSLKAVVVDRREEGILDEPLDIDFYVKDEDDEWKLEQFERQPESFAAEIRRLILTATTLPGDVYYVITVGMAEDVTERLADKVQELSAAGIATMEEMLRSK